MQRYKIDVRSSGGVGGEYEAGLKACDYFDKIAGDLLLSGSGGNSQWGDERDSHFVGLQSIITDLSNGSKLLGNQIQKDKLQQTNTLQYLQTQHQQIQQLSQQLYGSQTPWNAALAYRIPNTNININGQHQQGRTNVIVSCVADEYAPMLGANGFTNGVGPGNLGVSLNLSL